MVNKFTPSRQSFETFVDAVLDRTSCERHESPKGVPCWGITTSSGLGLGAICNKRAKRAGFTHKISQESLNNRRTKK